MKYFCREKSNEMSRSYAIKCEEFSLVNGVNDEYLKSNKKLNEENESLRKLLQNVKQELTEVKAKQMRTAKPFVDLTHDENSDSDVEIVEEKTTKPKSADKPTNVIVLEEETTQDIAEENLDEMMNDSTKKYEDKKPSTQLLDSWDFILEQIGTFRNA